MLLLVFYELSRYNRHMKIQLVPEKCIACGLCQTLSPLFDYDDEGIVRFASTEELSLDHEGTDSLKEAIRSCPTGAILAEK